VTGIRGHARKTRAGLAFLAGLVITCGEPPQLTPEDELRDTLLQIIEAIEGGDPKTILEHVSFDFQSEDGLGYAEVQSIVLNFLVRDQRAGARLEDLSIEQKNVGRGTHEVRARVVFAMGYSIREAHQPLPPGATRYEFLLGFTRTENGWQAIHGRYQQL
jgi:hypothetical protein